MLFFQLPVRAGENVTLAWNPSSTPDVAGYKIYYGTACGTYSNVVEVGNTTNAAISGLVPGTTYYFAATTLDNNGNESQFSNEAVYDVPALVTTPQQPTIRALPAASAIRYGQTLASSSLSGGLASAAGSFAFTTPGMAPNAGTANVSVTFAPADTNDFATVTANVSVVVNQALASVTLGSLNQMYDGTAKLVSVAISPTGLPVTVTYNGFAMSPTAAGSYQVVATVNDPNYVGGATNIFVVDKAPASVSLTNLVETFDGTPKPVTASTIPANLTVLLTYNSFTNAPADAGSYAVVGTIENPNYQGTVTNSLIISPAAPGASANQSVALGWNPSPSTDVAGYKIYYGTASHNYTNSVMVGNVTNATISGLVAGQTYYFAATAFDDRGDESQLSDEVSYHVPLWTPTITEPPVASAITYGQTLACSSLSGGAASTAGSFAFTTPGMAPDAGTANVSVTFTPADTNDFATVTANLRVQVTRAPATVTIGNLNQLFDGTAKPVGVATAPAGLSVGVTYDGLAAVPTNAGSHVVVAMVNDPNYAGDATNTLVIGRTTAMVTVGNLSQAYDGAAKTVTVTTTPANLAVSVTCDGEANAPTNAGSYTVVATVADPDYAGSVTNILVVNPASACITLTNLVRAYDGTAKCVTACTTPTSLAVILSYGGGTNAPAEAGQYTVTATIIDPNYQGGATNTLSILPATPATLSTAVRSGNKFSFTITGMAGETYVVQASTNLVDWISLETNAAPFLFTDTNAAGFNRRFYRVFYLPP